MRDRKPRPTAFEVKSEKKNKNKELGSRSDRLLGQLPADSSTGGTRVQ